MEEEDEDLSCRRASVSRVEPGNVFPTQVTKASSQLLLFLCLLDRNSKFPRTGHMRSASRLPSDLWLLS